MAYMGASVFHDEAILPVREAAIPIRIKNTNRSGRSRHFNRQDAQRRYHCRHGDCRDCRPEGFFDDLSREVPDE